MTVSAHLHHHNSYGAFLEIVIGVDAVQ